MRYTSYNSNQLKSLSVVALVGFIIYKFFVKTSSQENSDYIDEGGVPLPKQTEKQKTPQNKGVNTNQRYDSDAKLTALASSLKDEFFALNTDEAKIVYWLKTIKSDADYSFLSKQFGSVRVQFSLIYRNLMQYIQATLDYKEIADVQQNWNRKPQITIKL